tara:strand:+ start:4138 stop:4260 length:123 start_codon:yes stop_codon:yes gene_type:complete
MTDNQVRFMGNASTHKTSVEKFLKEVKPYKLRKFGLVAQW